MDWTGGARRRYAPSGRKNAVLQKQKAHFAKVRANGAIDARSSMPDFIRQEMAAKGRLHLDESRGQAQTVGDSHVGSHSNPRSVDSRSRTRHTSTLATEQSHRRITNEKPCSELRGDTHEAFLRQKQTRPDALLPQLPDEELRAHRQQLLNHGNWLGLAASRPLKIKFPAERERDRVGKRRKLDRSRREPSPALQYRRVMPAFQFRGEKHDPMTNGANQGHEIQIKIGTEAFASQTQRSLLSPAPIQSSMRAPSTEFGPLSEESMLMGEEDEVDAIELHETVSSHAEFESLESRPEIIPDTGSVDSRAPMAATLSAREFKPVNAAGNRRKYAPVMPYTPLEDVWSGDRRRHEHRTIKDTSASSLWQDCAWAEHDQQSPPLSTSQRAVPATSVGLDEPTSRSQPGERPRRHGRGWRVSKLPISTSLAAVRSVSLTRTISTSDLNDSISRSGSTPPQHDHERPRESNFPRNASSCQPVVEPNVDEAPIGLIAAAGRSETSLLLDISNPKPPVQDTKRDSDDLFWRQAIIGSAGPDSSSQTT